MIDKEKINQDIDIKLNKGIAYDVFSSIGKLYIPFGILFGSVVKKNSQILAIIYLLLYLKNLIININKKKIY